MQNFHWRKRLRLINYDYSFPGSYFVTICIKDKIQKFGHIENDKLILNQLGEVAKISWLQIPKFYNDVFVDEFIIMPNHIHGILHVIYDFDYVTREEAINVGAINNRPYQYNRPCQYDHPYDNHYGLLSRVIKMYKRDVSKTIHLNFDPTFVWQKSFYEKIIKNDYQLNIVRQYVFNNPLNWKNDRFN